MKVFSDNDTYLGKIEYDPYFGITGGYLFEPRGKMTEYMLEQALMRLRGIDKK